MFSPSPRKHELLTRSLRKMERTLDTVLRSIGNPSIASGMVSRSPSPSAQLAGTQALLSQGDPSTSPSPTYQPSRFQQPGSPKLHSLPDNSLNPLGLLAEASLANRRAQALTKTGRPLTSPTAQSAASKAMGVASDSYFKPGPSERLSSVFVPSVNRGCLLFRPDDHLAVTAPVHRASDPAGDA